MGEVEQLRLAGNSAFKNEDWDAAITSYSEAINAWNVDHVDGELPDKRIYSNRAAAYIKKALEVESTVTFEFALEDAEKAIELDPKWAKAWYRKAVALGGLERLDDAKQAYVDGLEHCPGDADLVEGLAELASGPNKTKRTVKKASEPVERTGVVVDTSLYDTLGVSPEATEGNIKKAYYHMAKECHPDKNPDDPNATEKFQKIGHAYQVLSNSDTRKIYDEQGLDGLQNADFEPMDPSQLFAMLFGSDKFNPYVGELQIVAHMSHPDEDGNPPSGEETRRIQKEREDKLVEGFLKMIMPWVEGRKAEFEAWAKAQTDELKETNFGPVMLHTIGFVYHRKSVIELGRGRLGGIPALVNSVKYTGSKFSTQFKAGYSVVKVMDQQRKLEAAAKGEEGKPPLTEEEKAKMTVGLAESAIGLVWSMSNVDIQSTLDSVCDRILAGADLPEDPAAKAKGGNVIDHVGSFVSSFGQFKPKRELTEGHKADSREEILHARATAMKKIGRIFMEAGSMDEMKGAAALFEASGDTGSDQADSPPAATPLNA